MSFGYEMGGLIELATVVGLYAALVWFVHRRLRNREMGRDKDGQD